MKSLWISGFECVYLTATARVARLSCSKITANALFVHVLDVLF